MGAWALKPLYTVLRDHVKANHITLAMRRDGPRTECIHVEAFYEDHSVEVTIHEPDWKAVER